MMRSQSGMLLTVHVLACAWRPALGPAVLTVHRAGPWTRCPALGH